MTPTRIQRKRTKGYRLPPNTLCCTRPGKWGNPFETAEEFRTGMQDASESFWPVAPHPRGMSGEVFMRLLHIHNYLEDLRQFDHLACWCPLDADCHVDVLIELLRKENDV